MSRIFIATAAKEMNFFYMCQISLCRLTVLICV